MKTEDIDKKIGMPDVDAEWARFEHEVISGGTKRRSALAWAFGIGIAASVALLLIINIGKEQMEQVPLIAQTEEIKPQPTPQPIKEEVQPKEQEVVKKASTPVIAQNKRPASTNANASPTSSLDIPAREYTGAVQKPKMDDLEGLAFESVDQALQNIASADLGSGKTLRLRGTGDYRPSDKDRMDSTLILVNGEPLPEYLKQDVLGNNPDDIDTHMPRYFFQQGLLIDSVYVHKDSYYTEKYGGLAKYGVIEIKTVPDTYCDAYVRNHPKLMKKYTRVEGYVVDNDGKPLTEAWVHIKKKYLTGAATDSTGHYAIWLPTRDVELCAEQAGYRTVEFSPSDKTLVMHLEPGASMRLRGNPEPTSELQGVIAGLPDAPPNDSILYIVNGVPQPKENNKWLGKMSYLDYFKRQHLLVDSVKRNMNEEAKRRYLERFGEAAKHGVVEYFCVEDTLCDYYMNQHEELKASRRRVSGVVLDENDEPLDHTIIHILQFEPEKKIWGFETTDSLGNFAFWVPRTGVKMNFKYIGYKAVVVEPSDKTLVMHLEPSASMRLRGNPEPTSELQGQIAGLPPIDIRRVKNDYRRTVNKQAPDTILTLVNGKEDEAFLPYLRKNPYWSRTFIYDYFFERNQLFIRQYRPEGDEINKYAHLFNGRDIRFILDYQSRPYKPVGQFTPDELKARRLAYLLRCYREGKNDQDNHGMLAPDLFDTPAEERLFGLLGVKYWQGNRFEKFGHISRDSRGTYIPLERHMQFTVQDQIWEENGEWLGMEDDERFNAVIKELDEAANGASSSLVEPSDSVVAMAFIYGGKVAKGALHESDVMWEKPFKDKVKGSIFEFTPDEDAPSYWTAEIYYSTQFPRYMVVYLNSVDKLYASECPDILNIHYKRLTGVVEDEEGKPVSGGLVSYRERPYFSGHAATDSLGRFELMLPNTSDTISVIRIDYEKQTIRVLPTDSVLTIRLKKIDWKELRESLKKKQ